jgi:hypothetical protein
MVREEPGEVQVFHFRESGPFAQGKAQEGPGAGASVHDVAENPLTSPHKPRREGQEEGGLPGAKGYATG